MSAPYGDPAYAALTWHLGYQDRQFGVAGPSVLSALDSPPQAMIDAQTP